MLNFYDRDAGDECGEEVGTHGVENSCTHRCSIADSSAICLSTGDAEEPLYLPVEVAGALFSTGDGHGRQGDGEVSNTAIECPMERCERTFDLRDDLPSGQLYAETAAGWLAFGLDEHLGTAARAAVGAMQALMQRRLGISSRAEALALASVMVDLRVSQIANGVHGVHAVLPHDALL